MLFLKIILISVLYLCNASYSSVVLLDDKVNDNSNKIEKPGSNGKINEEYDENENDRTMIEGEDEEENDEVGNKDATLIVGKLNNENNKTTIEKNPKKNQSNKDIKNNKHETVTAGKLNDNKEHNNKKDQSKKDDKTTIIDKLNDNKEIIDNNSQDKLNQLPKTLIKYDEKQLNSEEKKVVKKVNAITFFTFGTEGKPLIEIYVSPSCLHCAHFLIDDLEKFLKEHKEECFVKVMLIPVDAKDFFIMKLIQAEAKDTNGYYMIFTNYMKRVLADIDKVKPTEQQKELYKGSNTDKEMIKFQVIANIDNFGFADDKIINAIPNMDEDYECAVVEYYKETVKEIFSKLKLDKQKSPEIEVPLIIYNNKLYKELNDALKACNENNKKTTN